MFTFTFIFTFTFTFTFTVIYIDMKELNNVLNVYKYLLVYHVKTQRSVYFQIVA